MALTVIATAGAVDANSYVTEAEATAYFEARLPLPTPWDDNDDQAASLVMATRLLDAFFRGSKTIIAAQKGVPAYLRKGPRWKGVAASTTQRLAWPRTGLLTQNGATLSSTTIPQEIKDATCELAGQLAIKDTSLDSAVSTFGLTSVKAGSVSASFSDLVRAPKPMPDAVLLLIPADWYTEEQIQAVYKFDFAVIP